ncbi:aspartate/glutamate racemase family protein [Maritalea mediterranea]|uniref:Aspartate/glutamate racemase family protein n=1 Tax=Maritalea mediterranea TaxID=2909667 RepID=A0ABS9E6X9_9HYPH|nr:aspartate/glutamate racemase family protein [Maritalea mediterranea]MCF4097530.1 aspartate/glutamate racemase family protein [Maritalea mediterranea]
MKTIGLLGGMSWESTALYYKQINEMVRAKKGGLHSADLLMHSVDFAPIAQMQKDGAWDEAGQLLASHANGLEKAGADFLVLATNTMHLVAAQIEAATNVPLLHIGDATATALKTDGFERVGLLGTAFTMEKPFLIDRLQSHGLDIVVPDVDRTNLNAIIFDELCRGVVSDQSRQTYQRAIDGMMARGAEAVILGCTEITLLISDDDSPIPTYDSTALHVKAAVEKALS